MSHKTETRQRRPLGRRHEAGCKICRHPEREEIEAEWISWGNTTRLAKKFGLSKDSVYRHCHALSLFAKRSHNLKAALGRIIEAGDGIKPSSAAVVQAIQAYAKINAVGQWIDKTEVVSLNDLFSRMSAGELENYAKTGDLPDWFSAVVGATPSDGQEDKVNG